MSEAIGIRLETDMLKKIDFLGRVESMDRSTIIRRLLVKGFQEEIKEKSAEEYLEGSITLSEAAHRAKLTLWDFQHYLVDKGFKSSYSIEDIDEEIKLLSK